MIAPRTKTIDTTQGECTITCFRHRESVELQKIGVEIRTTDDENRHLELTGRIQDMARSHCSLTDEQWGDLEQWEADNIVAEVRDLSFSAAEKN